MVDWTKVKNFTEKENWGKPLLMDTNLVMRLDNMREYIGDKHPVIIHCGYAASGHSEHSQHYDGKATDCHIVDMSLLDQYLVAEKFGFTGIGVYPFWTPKGLHLDTRTLSIYHGGARWIQIISDGKKEYIGINEANVLKYLGQG